ncbi:MAG: CoA-binding protein [Bacteroidota bacterium]
MDLRTADLRTALDDARTIAVVGCSPRATRTSHRIARYLQDAGYTVVPINPHHDELLGVPCYPDVLRIPEGTAVDIVNVFRQPRFTEGVVQDTIDWSERAGQRPLVWTQLGVSSREAEQLAAAHDLPYVVNRCIMVEHARLV